MSRLLSVAFTLFFAMPLAAQQTSNLQTLFVEDIAPFQNADGTIGMYTQDWRGMLIGTQETGQKTVYLESEGKSGAFYGVLSVDCATPTRSQWLTQSLPVLEGEVPLAAITAIRALVC